MFPKSHPIQTTIGRRPPVLPEYYTIITANKVPPNHDVGAGGSAFENPHPSARSPASMPSARMPPILCSTTHCHCCRRPAKRCCATLTAAHHRRIRWLAVASVAADRLAMLGKLAASPRTRRPCYIDRVTDAGGSHHHSDVNARINSAQRRSRFDNDNDEEPAEDELEAVGRCDKSSSSIINRRRSRNRVVSRCQMKRRSRDNSSPTRSLGLLSLADSHYIYIIFSYIFASELIIHYSHLYTNLQTNTRHTKLCPVLK